MIDYQEGKFLKFWLSENGYTVESFADTIGVSKQAVYDQFKNELVAHTFKVKQ
jgi:hypothetical protein